jgi:hypothetical protein
VQEPEEDAEQQDPSGTYVSRRGAIGLAAGGVGAAAAGLGVGLVIGGSDAAASERLVVDVACIGDTFRAIPMPEVLDKVRDIPGAVDPGDLRGSPFTTEGWMYPEGTIRGPGFVPTEEGVIGHWFCRGHFILNPGRVAPHVMSHHEYIFGLIQPDNLFPPDMLCSVGLESSEERVQSGMRAINGGTGKYRAASGQVEQVELGVNSTVLFSLEGLAPSFRFDFDLLIP